MKRIVLALVMVVTVVASIATATQVSATPAQGQADLLQHLAGKWVFEVGVLGDGFLGSTFPGATTPPKEVRHEGQKVSFVARLQTGQGSYGEPVMGDFTFALEKATGDGYLLSVESKSWLNLTQQKLLATPSGAKGETKLSLGGAQMTLATSIELTQPKGHKWHFTLNDVNGKPKRWFRLTFKPAEP